MDLWDDCRRSRFDDEDIDLIKRQEELEKEEEEKRRLEMLYQDELNMLLYYEAEKKDLYDED